MNKANGYALDLFDDYEHDDHHCDFDCLKECDLCGATQCGNHSDIEEWVVKSEIVLCNKCDERCE